MTSSRYLVARFAQAFGYIRRSQRMADAASEMHLLREAEAYLGAAIWEKVEGIEALSVEYWNLRKLVKEQSEVRAKLTACQARLDLAHEERANVLNSPAELHQELLDERAVLLVELEELARKRDQIVAEAREVRRSYIGFKTKLEVLTAESNGSTLIQEELDEVKSRLMQLKSQFAELKKERIAVGKKIEEGDAKVDLVDEKLKEKKKDRRSDASEAFQVISDGNKEISILRAESALIDTRMRQLFAEIGRHVSRHANQDKACAEASAAYHGLVEVMRALRRSVVLNHRLAGTA